ncbi:hypothetical protein ACJX0J_012159, partial [Zea mays]
KEYLHNWYTSIHMPISLNYFFGHYINDNKSGVGIILEIVDQLHSSRVGKDKWIYPWEMTVLVFVWLVSWLLAVTSIVSSITEAVKRQHTTCCLIASSATKGAFRYNFFMAQIFFKFTFFGFGTKSMNKEINKLQIIATR